VIIFISSTLLELICSLTEHPVAHWQQTNIVVPRISTP
jgi:hypothetical protein